MAIDKAVEQQREDGTLARQPESLPDPVLATNSKIVLEKRYLKRDGPRVLRGRDGPVTARVRHRARRSYSANGNWVAPVATSQR